MWNAQIVNFAPQEQQVDVEVLGLQSSPEMMTVRLLNNTDGLAENSFDEPYMVNFMPTRAFTHSQHSCKDASGHTCCTLCYVVTNKTG